MKRIRILLDESDKAWLVAAAAREGTTEAELVRRAVRLVRERASLERRPFDEILRRTHGLWRGDEGLPYQTRLRDDW